MPVGGLVLEMMKAWSVLMPDRQDSLLLGYRLAVSHSSYLQKSGAVDSVQLTSFEQVGFF